MVDYVVPKDLDSEEGKFTEKQYNDAGGVIRMNMAKALIKRHIREEENDPNLEIHFITQPSWIESHARVEETQDDPATDMLNTK
ncbi:MAG: hypothetical protein KBT06_04475 [Prevotellaceae bacterium]|nr:hypothetical protein [Candidatus Colivivens equi]